MSRLPIANSFAQGSQTGLGILDMLAQREYQQQRAQQEQQIQALREAQFAQQQQQQALQTAALKAQSQFNMRRLGSVLGPESAMDPEMQQLFATLPPSAQERFVNSVEEQGLLERERSQKYQEFTKQINAIDDFIKQSANNPALMQQGFDLAEKAVLERELQMYASGGTRPPADFMERVSDFARGERNTGGLSLTPAQTSSILRDISQSRIEEANAVARAMAAGTVDPEGIRQLRQNYAQYRQERSQFLRDSGFPEDRIPQEPDRPEPQITLTPEENQSMATDLLSTATLIAGQAPGQEQMLLSAMSTLQTNPEFVRAWANKDTDTMVRLVRKAVIAQANPPQPQARPSTYNAIQP